MEEGYSTQPGSTINRATMAIDGMSSLRDGLRLYLISIGVMLIGSILVAGIMFMSMGRFIAPGNPGFMTPGGIEEIIDLVGIGTIILMITIAIISIVISIMGLIKIRDGMQALSTIYNDVSIGATGANLMFYGVILIGIGLLLLLVFIGIIGVLIGGLLILIGSILWSVGIMNLDKYTQEDLKTPALIYLVGVIISLIGLGFLGFILEVIGIYLLYTRITSEIDYIRRQPITQPKPQEEGWGI